MAFYRHLRTVNGRHLVTLGMTLGNLYRLRERAPVLMQDGNIRLALMRPHHGEPPSGFIGIVFGDETLARLEAEKLVEFSLVGISVVCVFGVFPADAAAAVQRVLKPALPPVPDDLEEARFEARWREPEQG